MITQNQLTRTRRAILDDLQDPSAGEVRAKLAAGSDVPDL